MAGSSGTGTATDAAAVIDYGAISAEEFAQRQADDYQVLVDAVPKAKAKVAKLEEQLAGAQDSLANAQAALAGATAPEGK